MSVSDPEKNDSKAPFLQEIGSLLLNSGICARSSSVLIISYEQDEEFMGKKPVMLIVAALQLSRVDRHQNAQ